MFSKICVLASVSALLFACSGSVEGGAVVGDTLDDTTFAPVSSEATYAASGPDFGAEQEGPGCDYPVFIKQGELILSRCPEPVTAQPPAEDVPPSAEPAPEPGPVAEPPVTDVPPAADVPPTQDPPAAEPPADAPPVVEEPPVLPPGTCDNVAGCDVTDVPPTCELPPEVPSVCKNDKIAVCHVPGHDPKGWEKRFTLCLPLPAVDGDPVGADHVGHGDVLGPCVF